MIFNVGFHKVLNTFMIYKKRFPRKERFCNELSHFRLEVPRGGEGGAP